MSFSYKKITSSDINVTKYKSNKSFKVNFNELNDNGINIYAGENTPVNTINSFDPINDNKTTNNEYRRLIFDSIKKLFYQNYIENDGIFTTSSSYEEYPQTTLYSGSYTTNLRRIGNITGSSFQGINSIYNGALYDEDALYDESAYSSGQGTIISVISIDKNIYGSNIKPSSFILESGSFYIRDDGEGNIFDYGNLENYNTIIESGIPTAIYVGNIFYSHGLIILTNPEYICAIDLPPIAINNYYTYNNLNQPVNFDILENDFSDCGGINYSSINLIPLSSSFPDCYIGGDTLLYIIQNQQSFIPGNYQIGYQIENNIGLLSNIATINIVITADELKVNNIQTEKVCPGISTLTSYSFDINGGVPEYSFSFDNTNYTNISGFYNIEVTGSINSNNNTLYIKDYIGNIISQSISFFHDEIDVDMTINNSPSCTTSGSIIVSSSNAIKFIVGVNPTEYTIPNLITLSTGSNYITLYDNNNCSITSSFNIGQNPPFTYTIVTSSISCYNNDNGTININYTENDTDIVSIEVIYPNTSSSIYNTSSLLLEDLVSGSYNIIIDNQTCIQSSNVILTSPGLFVISATASYDNECYSTINFNISGGVSPYTYNIISPSTVYVSDSSSITLYSDGLNAMTVIASVIDASGCVSNIVNPEVYGRVNIYSGSYCEQ